MKWYGKREKALTSQSSYKRRIFDQLPLWVKKFFSRYLGLYPRVVRHESRAVSQVLGGTSWNMSYSVNGKHVELEKKIAEYVGSECAVAVGSGGVAIQMLMRALGLNPQSEVLIQADTCSAVPQAILNAQAIPVMVDADTKNFQFSIESLITSITKNSKIILATHMWGNPENLQALEEIARNRDLLVIEDACLALGGKSEGRFLGSISHAGVFSFGSTKPLQAGEGGIIVTNNKDLAKELKSLRGWGDREIEYGHRDVKTLSWNGRMPEVTAAIAFEQLYGYPKRLARIQSRVANFRQFVSEVPDISVVPAPNETELAFTQLSIKITADSRFTKNELVNMFGAEGVLSFHANFEPLTELSLFRSGDWLNWIRDGDQRINPSQGDFPGAYEIYLNSGLGLLRSNFESLRNYNNLIRATRKIFNY